MTLEARPEKRRRRSAVSFACSAGVHGSVLAWVALGPMIPRGPAPSLYDLAIRPNEKKIVWYSLKDRLPDVSPSVRRDPRPPRARTRAPRVLVSGEKDTSHPPQLIWTPAPEVKEQQVLPSPNILALARPAPPPRPEAPPAPPKPQPREFKPPPVTPTEATKPSLPAAPEMTMAQPKAPALPSVLPPIAAARRAFIPPVEAARAPAPQPASLPEAPQIREVASVTPPAVPGVSTGRPVRAFTAPAPARTSTPTAPAPLSAPPPATPGDRTSEASLAIVGLFPSNKIEVPKPKGSQQAGFSAGPQLRPEGGNGDAQPGQLVVPGLLARGDNASTAPDPRAVLMASIDTPTSRRNLMGAVRSARVETETAPSPGAVEPRHAVRVSDSPDPRLSGRAIYALSIQMPNITSFSGSWLVWFAERNPAAGQSTDLQAPLPLHKVDPKYVAAAAEERVEGKVRLAAVIRKDGHVDTVELIQHLDARLDRSAAEALAKWEFEPALRNGHPVDIDAVFDIPFHLAPRITK